MSYLPESLEELQKRYHVQYIPIKKDEPDGKFLTFVGIKNKALQKKESIWFSQFAVQDIVRRAKLEQLQTIMGEKGTSDI